MKPTRAQALLLQTPVVACILVFVAAPTLLLFAAAFSPGGLFRLDLGEWSTSSFDAVLSNDAHGTQLVRSIIIGLATTLFSVLGGYTLAHWVVFRARRTGLWLSLIVVALVASYIGRIYAWRTILGSEGPLSQLLSGMGIIEEGRAVILFTRPAVVIAQVNVFLPLSALILASALARVDRVLFEASRSSGYGSLATLIWVTLPQVGRALLTAVSFTFFLATGDYITPVLLGGTSSTTLGALIATQYKATGDYSTGAVLALEMLVVFLVFVIAARWMLRAFDMLPKTQ